MRARGGKAGRKELAEAHGVGIETLRYYESIGLLDPPERDGNNYRRYGADAAAALRFILAAKERGFSLAEIRGFIAVVRGKGASAAAMRAVIDAKIAALAAEARAIEARIALLAALRSEPRLGECDLMAALEERGLTL